MSLSKTQLRNLKAFNKLHKLEHKHLQMDLAAKLRQLLLKIDITQGEFAKRVGVSGAGISKIMSSEVTCLPSVEKLDQMMAEAEKLQKESV
jgi:predicted transcriptional regulator